MEDEEEFYEEADDYDDEWDLDNYEEEYDAKYNLDTPEGVNLNWQRDFMQFKKDNKTNTTTGILMTNLKTKSLNCQR